MGKVYGREVQAIPISIKGSTRMIKNQVMAYSHGQQVTYTRVIIKMIIDMVTVKCIGVMAVFIRENGEKASSMEKVRYMYQEKDIRRVSLKIMCL